MAQQVDGFDSMFNLGGKSMSQGTFSSTPFGQNHNLDPSSLDPSQPAYQPPQHMNNMSGHHQQNHPQQIAPHAGFLADSSSHTQTQTMNHADMNAATSLYGFANKIAPHQAFSPPTNGGAGPMPAGSWGALTVGSSANMPPGSGYSNAPSGAGRASSFADHAQSQAQGWNGDMSQANPRHNSRGGGAEASYLVPNPFSGVQQQQPTPQHQQALGFPGVAFGSDPNFANNTPYQGPQPQNSKDLSGNLLNVPLADKARTPYGPASMANQFTNPQVGGSWGSLGSSGITRPSDDDDFASGSQARKRHKGQADRNSEHGWDPRMAQQMGGGSQAIKVEETDDEPTMPAPSARAITSPSSAKRRRPTDGQTSQVSNSPPANQDDDGGEASARKRGAKKRENLTEDQKRRNHIHSEKKRREIIQQGYADLNKLVPCLANGKSGLSRSECLQEIGAYLEVLSMGNAKIEEAIGAEAVGSHPALQAVQAEWAAATSRIE